jgi:hypothetical protein
MIGMRHKKGKRMIVNDLQKIQKRYSKLRVKAREQMKRHLIQDKQQRNKKSVNKLYKMLQGNQLNWNKKIHD